MNEKNINIRGILDVAEPHPAAQDALKFIVGLGLQKLAMYQESFSSCAIEGNRLGEICRETLHRIMMGQPVSDRYVLGVAFTIRQMNDGCDFEMWISIKGFDYSVSNFGRVRRETNCANAKKGQILALIPDKAGYLKVHVYNRGVGKIFPIHRLVSDAFIGPIPLGLQINHKDGNKENNVPSNLEYVTSSENQKHAYLLGLKCQKGSKNNASKLTEADVVAIKERLGKGEWQKNIAKDYNVSSSTIGGIKRGECWHDVSKKL